MRRLSRLDGLRGVLAVYVMLGHAMPFTDLPSWLTGPLHHGEAAVDLFFALSGLVIVNSLAHFKYRFWRFFEARAWRLLPVYFTVLTLAVALLAAGSPLSHLPWVIPGSPAGQFWTPALPRNFAAHLAAHFLLLHGVIPQGALPYVWVTLLGPAWSLSTEWQFYLLIALVLPVLPGPDRLRVFALGLLGLGVIYHVAAPFFSPWWQFSRAFLPDAAGFFALGLAANIWLRGGGILFLLFCSAVVCGLGLFSGTSARALIPVGWMLVLLAQRYPNFPVLGRLLDSRAAQFLGAVSYPLYLLNEPVQRAAAMLAGPLAAGNARLFTVIWLPLALAGPVLAASVLHYGIEKPLMRPRQFSLTRPRWRRRS